MSVGLQQVCRCVVLASAIGLLSGAGATAFVWDGRWEGLWEPKDSCRDSQERRVTAVIEDGEIHGEVDNSPEAPGTFVAEIKPNGKFIATIKGFKRDRFKVFGRVTPSEIEAKWTGHNDCGTGELVLEPVEEGQDAAGTGEPQGGGDTNPVAALKALRDQGVITEEEYQAKLEALASQPRSNVGAPPTPPPRDPRLSALDDLLTSGAISADEYLARRNAIIGSGQ